MTKQKKVKLSTSQVASFGAIVISLAALGIGILQANIMSAQQQIMSDQQKASVWPYVYVDTKLGLENGAYNMLVTIENKGVGPAIVKSMELIFNGNSYDSYNKFNEELERIGMIPTSRMSFLISSNSEKVLKPSELQEVFALEVSQLDSAQLSALASIRLELIYCSVHDDCWRENGREMDRDE